MHALYLLHIYTVLLFRVCVYLTPSSGKSWVFLAQNDLYLHSCYYYKIIDAQQARLIIIYKNTKYKLRKTQNQHSSMVQQDLQK